VRQADPTAGARVPAWLVALLCLMAFAFQGTRGIWEPDESRYSSAGIQMLESGDWLVPTVDGEHPHFTKPPVTYWALASSFALLGQNEWAARLPSALAYVGTGLLVFGLGRRFCPRRPWLPALVWSLSPAPVIAANIISTDPLLAFFDTLAMYAFVEARARAPAQAGRWYTLMWLGWGLAFLTKGPPALLPLLAALVFVACHDRPRLRGVFVPPGLLLFAVVAFTWFGILVARHPGLLGYFLGHEVYNRVFTAAHDRNAHWYGAFEVYVPVLALGMLPWSALALTAAGGPRGAWNAFRDRLRRRDPDWLLLAWWLLLPLAVFFLARSRLQLYVLPLFVPLALMTARALAQWPRLSARGLAWTAVLTAVALIALKGTISYIHYDRDARAIGAEIEALLQGRSVDGIVFVNMRPFYGLNIYLEAPVDGLDVGPHRYEYSRNVAPAGLCRELLADPRKVYAIKSGQAAAFDTTLAGCGAAPLTLGSVFADGNDIRVFAVGPATP
jgi:4-amino-4-deoxy-L-arabinose transferase-like glycosyltransferase